MKKRFLSLTGALLIAGIYTAAPVCAQASSYTGAPGAAIGLIQLIAAQNAANKVFLERTTSTATYRGQSFLKQRTPADILVGDAADRITQVEAQLALSYTALLADSTSRTCSPEQQATIQTNLNYLSLNRPGWNLKTYRQELKFYVAEDKRRKQATR